VAFGISSERNDARRQGIDSTNEVAAEDLKDDRLRLADDQEHLKDRDIFIVTVPTPIDEGTKWNFLKFHPGLVGGHCIGVDPYYLTAKAEQVGYHPEVILSGRRVNDGMGAYVAQRVIKLLSASGQPIAGARVGILGFTFKENVPDIRNSKVVDIYLELLKFGITPIVHDPKADVIEMLENHRIRLAPLEEFTDLTALVFAVPHREFASLDGRSISEMIAPGGILIDVKANVQPRSIRDDITYWSL